MALEPPARRKAPIGPSVSPVRKLSVFKMQQGRWIAGERLRKRSFQEIAEELGLKKTTVVTLHSTFLGAISDTEVSAARRSEVFKLDAMEEGLWDIARDPTHRRQYWAIDRLLMVAERRARLLGLDSPTRQTVTVISEDVVDAEISRLTAEIRERPAGEAQAITGTSEESRIPSTQ